MGRWTTEALVMCGTMKSSRERENKGGDGGGDLSVSK